MPGADGQTLKVGVQYIDLAALGAFGEAAGIQGVGSTEPLAAYQAVVDVVNAEGGVAGGRQLVIVPSEFRLSENRDTNNQRACEAWTTDDRVVVANLPFAQGQAGPGCLVERGVMTGVAGAVAAGSQRDFDAYGGLLVAPGTADTITAADAYVEALVRQGLLTPESTVGLLWFNFQDLAVARAEGLLPALARNGITLAAEFESSYGGDLSEVGRINTEMQNASLQFRTAGVDTVLTLDFNATLQYFFMVNSENQGYRPTHAIASWGQPQFLQGNAPPAQLQGARGIGWVAAQDVDTDRQPGTEPHRRCEQIMIDAGMPVTTFLDRAIQQSACGTVFFWQTLLNTTDDLAPASLADTVQALADQPSYTGFSDRFAPGKPWGAQTYRDILWDTGCSCFTYSGDLQPFG